MISDKGLVRAGVYLADIPVHDGWVIYGKRPVVILQGVENPSHTVVCIPLTSRVKNPSPTRIRLSALECGLRMDSTALTEQVICLDKAQIGRFLTKLPDAAMKSIEKGVFSSLGFGFDMAA